jgi:hypothetical protein
MLVRAKAYIEVETAPSVTPFHALPPYKLLAERETKLDLE